jgi:hypothetical protein
LVNAAIASLSLLWFFAALSVGVKFHAPQRKFVDLIAAPCATFQIATGLR